MKAFLGDRLKENVALSRYTPARIGGPADGLVEISSSGDLVEVYRYLLSEKVPCKIIGGGSNLLISDDGYRGIILLNKSSEFHFERFGSEIYLFCDSGMYLGTLARQAAIQGVSGLEWATGIPGTVGGAAYGNAGAHGSDMQSTLSQVEVLLPGSETTLWSVEQMEYGYRSSRLKREKGQTPIVRVSLCMHQASAESIQAKMDEINQKRKASQPGGSSLGSIFKNPANDYAGRLLEAAGMKGVRIGGVEVSQKHANFFINEAAASAEDYYRLIRLAQKKVMDQFGIELETEIELLGDFKDGEVSWQQN
jgi:UDP-N-acetylmuramate dehydrogenase